MASYKSGATFIKSEIRKSSIFYVSDFKGFIDLKDFRLDKNTFSVFVAIVGFSYDRLSYVMLFLPSHIPPLSTHTTPAPQH